MRSARKSVKQEPLGDGAGSSSRRRKSSLEANNEDENFLHDSDNRDADIAIPDIGVRENTLAKWDRLPEGTRTQITKVCTRLLLMKGGKNDKVSTEHIKDALGQIDPSYRIHTQAALQAAQSTLKKTFGLDLVLSKNPDNTYVVNDLRSKALYRILAATDQNAGYRGFCHIIFVSIWTSLGRKIDASSLLRNVRKVDPNFSESLSDGTMASSSKKRDAAGGITELEGMSFLALLARMVKEGYLTESRDEQEPQNLGKRVYEFGVRFFVEVGVKQLALSYFLSLGVPVDQTVMGEIERESEGFLMGNSLPTEAEGGEEEAKRGRR